MIDLVKELKGCKTLDSALEKLQDYTIKIKRMSGDLKLLKSHEDYLILEYTQEREPRIHGFFLPFITEHEKKLQCIHPIKSEMIYTLKQ